jgi:hypothetical protein
MVCNVAQMIESFLTLQMSAYNRLQKITGQFSGQQQGTCRSPSSHQLLPSRYTTCGPFPECRLKCDARAVRLALGQGHRRAHGSHSRHEHPLQGRQGSSQGTSLRDRRPNDRFFRQTPQARLHAKLLPASAMR